MPDGIFYSERLGQDLFASVLPAWHRKGVRLEPGTDLEEGLRRAHLDDWRVRLFPVWSYDRHEEMLAPDTGLNVLMRWHPEVDGDGVWLPITDRLLTGNYEPLSNEYVLGPMVEALAGQSLPLDALGAMGRFGEVVFATFAMPDIDYGRGEVHKRYVVVLVDHSGRGAVQIMRVSLRVVCMNTAYMAREEALRDRTVVSVAHNKVAIDRFWEETDISRTVLSLSESYDRRMTAMVAELSKVEFNDLMWQNFAEALDEGLPRPKSKAGETRRSNEIRDMRYTWELEKARAKELGQQPTLWTAKQAVSTYYQHVAGSGDSQAKRSLALMSGRAPDPMVRAEKVLSFYLPQRKQRLLVPS